MFVMMLGLALGANNAKEIAALAKQVAAYDATIAKANGWVYDGTAPVDAVGAELKERLEAEAVELRAITKKLHILEGQARNAGKDDDLAAVEAVRAAMSVQRKERGFASKRVGAVLALSAAKADPAEWRKAETQVTAAARDWRGTPPDDWIMPVVKAAVDAERWTFVNASATWCSKVCADPTAAQAVLDKLPEGTGSDPRWVAVLRASESGGPAD